MRKGKSHDAFDNADPSSVTRELALVKWPRSPKVPR